MDDRSLSLFESEQDKDLIKCYFCFLLAQIDELRKSSENSQLNKLAERLWKLLENNLEPLSDFENEMIFSKILDLKASVDNDWKLLLNNLNQLII